MTTATFANPAAKVELNRVFNAPAKTVFEAFARADYWSRWFPPRGYTMTIQHMDFRVGGTFVATFQSPEGLSHPFSGTYTEIVPAERLAWTGEFPDGPPEQMLTTVTFKEQDGKTTLHVMHAFRVLTPETEMAVEGAPIGWGQTLDKLGEFLLDPTATLE